MGKEVKEQKGETGRKAVSHAFMRKDGGMNLREREVYPIYLEVGPTEFADRLDVGHKSQCNGLRFLFCFVF